MHSILKVYASSTDRIGSKLLYEYLVQQAKDYGISGVTVFRGIMGYGSSNKIASSKFWELTEKLPVLIEMIDENQKIEGFYKSIETTLLEMPKGCLVTKESVEVLLQKKGAKK